MLSIRNLTAAVNGNEILKGIDLEIKAGEVHAIMGSQRVGQVHPGQRSWRDIRPSRSQAARCASRGGTSSSWSRTSGPARASSSASSTPSRFPAVSNASFLRLAYNKKAEAEGRDELDPLEFDDFIQAKILGVKMDASFLDRSLNEGFSGGRGRSATRSSR